MASLKIVALVPIPLNVLPSTSLPRPHENMNNSGAQCFFAIPILIISAFDAFLILRTRLPISEEIAPEV
jgi:hypothetical protein